MPDWAGRNPGQKNIWPHTYRSKFQGIRFSFLQRRCFNIVSSYIHNINNTTNTQSNDRLIYSTFISLTPLISSSSSTNISSICCCFSSLLHTSWGGINSWNSQGNHQAPEHQTHNINKGRNITQERTTWQDCYYRWQQRGARNKGSLRGLSRATDATTIVLCPASHGYQFLTIKSREGTLQIMGSFGPRLFITHPLSTVTIRKTKKWMSFQTTSTWQKHVCLPYILLPKVTYSSLQNYNLKTILHIHLLVSMPGLTSISIGNFVVFPFWFFWV